MNQRPLLFLRIHFLGVALFYLFHISAVNRSTSELSVDVSLRGQSQSCQFPDLSLSFIRRVDLYLSALSFLSITSRSILSFIIKAAFLFKTLVLMRLLFFDNKIP